jgi:uncharacterized membrane protein
MQGFIDFLKHAQLHPAVDHFTVALLIVGILVDLFASLVPLRLWLRYMALTLMILGAIAAAGSNLTGGWEAGRVWDSVNGPAKDVLKRHAELGDYLPWVFGALAIWRLGLQFIGFIGRTRVVYIVVAVLAGVVLGYQGHLGGVLAYDYGVGTALMPSGTPSPAELAPQQNAQPTPIPTVYVPPPPELPTATATASAVATPIAAVPMATITPTTTSSGTPVNPPPGENAPSSGTKPPASKPTTL